VVFGETTTEKEIVPVLHELIWTGNFRILIQRV
jgi:hypothetical protein